MSNETSTTTSTKPEFVIRYGGVKATIWKKEGQYGPFYSATIARTYRNDDGSFADSNSFSPLELLAVQHVSKQASDIIQKLDQED